MKICAIDIETLGTAQESVVLSVGIVFNSEVRESVLFAANFQIPPQLRKGRKIDSSTVDWWGSQPDEAWAASTFNPRVPPDVLSEISELIKTHEPAEIWARGSMDQHVLESLFRCFDIEIPWRYSRWRDERTLDRLGAELGIEPLERRHLVHSALGDAGNCLENVEYLKRILALGLVNL